LLSKDIAVQRALTFEIGIQNSGLALVILLAQLQGLGGAAAIAAVWGVWHLIAGGIIVQVFRMSDSKSRQQWQPR
jgi:BASS family bile acid:Na+ symporter